MQSIRQEMDLNTEQGENTKEEQTVPLYPKAGHATGKVRRRYFKTQVSKKWYSQKEEGNAKGTFKKQFIQ